MVIEHKKIITITLPFASILVLLLAVILIKPEPTGLVIYDNSSRKIDAAVTLNLFEGEVLPSDSIVLIDIDGKTARISVSEFIQKSGGEFNYTQGILRAANYIGYGYTGNYTYKLNLSQLLIERNLTSGNHLLTMNIIYGRTVLSERKKNIFIN